jgi:hypothetical protein
MSDVLQRLRCTVPCSVEDARSGCHCAEAREEITALRAENERLRAELDRVAKELEVALLRAALSQPAEENPNG